MSGSEHRPWRGRAIVGPAAQVVVVALLVLAACAAAALAAQSGGQEQTAPAEATALSASSGVEVKSASISKEGVEFALGSQGFEAPPTNPQAAEELPHTDLGREEAVELVTGVFEPQLQAPAGIFDELEVEKFLSANAAILGPGDAPEAGGAPGGESEEAPVLLESLVPIRTDDESGRPVAVDLSLERSEGQIQPAEPLTEVTLPQEISEGIEFPGSGVVVDLEEAPAMRSASIIDSSVAFYPNVAADTDLSLAPSPYGLDTLTQVRSADAPDTQTFHLHLPQGASLKATDTGGAEVLEAGETALSIPAPSAIDANGDSVPVSLEVSGDKLTVRVTLGPSTAYPVLVDPAFEEWNWAGGGSADFSAWTSTTNSPKIVALTHVECVNSWECEPGVSNGEPGLYLLANHGPFPAGAEANWSYYVPRWASDQEKYGFRPQSFIASVTIEKLGFFSPGFEQPRPTSPQFIAGIWNTESSPEGWASPGSVYHHSDADSPGILQPNGTKYIIPGNNVHDAKRAIISLAYPQAPESEGRTEAFAGNVAITVGDEEPPAFGSVSGPGWTDSSTPPIHFRVTDAGLGVQAIRIGETTIVAGQEVWKTGAGPSYPWTTERGCKGTAADPCPRVWSSSESGAPQLAYHPGELSQGIHKFAVIAADPTADPTVLPGGLPAQNHGEKSAPSYILIKVDRTAPEVSALWGSLTASGAKVKPKDYRLGVTASDGSEAAPQSGVGSVEFKVDGTQVKKVSCEKQSCALEPEWVLHAASYALGSHTAEVIVEDRVGHVVKREAKFTVEKDTTAPEITTMAEATGGSYPAGIYPLQVVVADKGAGIAKLELLADGKRVGAPVLEPCAEEEEDEEEGHCLTATANLSQVFQINMAEYTPGSHALELIATDGYGNSARKQGAMNVEAGVGTSKVAPSLTLSGTMTEQATLGTSRPQYVLTTEASAGDEGEGTASTAPTYSSSFGSWGGSNGQFRHPSDVARDGKGDLWVTDWSNDRVEEFNEAGEYLSQFGSEGTGNGQLEQPTAIAIDAKGDLWVADSANGRVEEFNEKGEYLSQFGSKGTGPGQFASPGPEGIAIDSHGDVWVSDTYGARLEEFNEQGEFIKAVGSKGSEPGQLAEPKGIDFAPNGDLYVADWVNQRVEVYSEAGEYVSQFGSEGAGNGQFHFPDALAVDAQGDVWVGDAYHGRVEEFDGAGEYLAQFGSPGSGNGQLGYDTMAGIATDAQGDIWVADSENGRVEQWRVPGYAPTFQRAFGGEGSGPGHLSDPRALATDAGGRVWVADSGRSHIQEFDAGGHFIRQFGSYGTRNGQFRYPAAIAIGPEADVFVADTYNNRIQVFDYEGHFIRQFGSYGTGNGQLSSPEGIAIGPEGEVWVADMSNNRIQEFGPEGAFIRQFGSYGTGNRQFLFPAGIATDSEGNVWVADTGNNRLQELGPQGEFIRTVGSEGEGEGQFNQPVGVAVGPEGNLWVADTKNDRLQELGPQGEYLSQFGSGGDNEGQFYEPMGIVADYKGDIWIADTRNNRVQELAGGEFLRQFGGEGSGPGRLSLPNADATDAAGDVWVADTRNDRVQEFSAAGEFIRQFGSAGSHHGQFYGPQGIAVDPEGDVWVADNGNRRLQEFTDEGEFIREISSFSHELSEQEEEEGEEEEGQFESPAALAVDPEGNVWVADAGNRIEEFSPEGELIRLLGARGIQRWWVGCEGDEGTFCGPEGIAIGPEGEIWVADTGNNRLQEFGPQGAFIRTVGSEGEGEGQFNQPVGLAVGSAGEVFVAEAGNNRIQELGPKGEYLGQFGSGGDNEGQFAGPRGMALDANGNLWVADTRNNRLQELAGGEFIQQFGGEATGPGRLSLPAAVTTDPQGDVWVADTYNNRVQEFNAVGEFIRQFGTYGRGNGQFSSPDGIAIGSEGDVWVADHFNSRIEEFSSKGEFIRKVGSVGAGNGQFEVPGSLATDPQGDVWVADPYNYRIEEFNSKGEFIRQFGSKGSGNGQFNLPEGVAIGPEGNVWVADTENNRIEVLTPKGEFIRQAGSKGTGGGQLSLPRAIAVGPEGDAFVADTGNGRIEEFSPAGAYLSHFGAPGGSEGELSTPSGIAVSGEGEIFVADTSNNRVEAWSQPSKPGIARTEVTIDGEVVDTSPSGCSTLNCTIAREWTLPTASYTVGAHLVVVKAVSQAGVTTTKTLPIEIQRDTTKPTLSLSTPLVEAPGGWVEQHHYAFSASATDPNGSGVKSLVLKVDGVPAESDTNGCPNGGCKATLTEAINMADYTGGAHTAELVATDGAGNSISKKWTLNVDPKGTIGEGEAARTLEAMETTSPVVVVGEGEEHEQSQEGIEELVAGLELQEGEEGLESVGGGSPIVIASTDRNQPCTVAMQALPLESVEHEEGSESQEEEDEFDEAGPAELNEEAGEDGEESLSFIPQGEPLAVTPTQSEADSCQPALTNQVAAIESNTNSQADSVTRPLFDGAVMFEAIRGPSAPEEYSWTVELEEEQELSLLDDQQAEIAYPDGTVAVAITAEPAHDATGREIATTLSVSGDSTITLHVPYGAGSPDGQPYVYPILAGAGYQVGHEEVTIIYPPSEEGEEEIGEEVEEEGGPIVITSAESAPEAPEQISATEARVLELGPADPHVKLRKKFKFTVCRPHKGFDYIDVPEGPGGGEAKRTNTEHLRFDCQNPDHEGVFWAVSVHGRFHMLVHERVWIVSGEWSCNQIWGDSEHFETPVLRGCKAFFNEAPHVGNGIRWVKGPIYVRGLYRFASGHGHWGPARRACLTIGGNLFPNPRKPWDHPYEEPLVYHRPVYLEPWEPDCTPL